MSEPIVFIASIAPTNTGLSIHGIDGYRILLDIPDDELAAVMRLALLRGKALRVTVDEAQQQPTKPEPKKKKRKEPVPEWGDDDGAEAGDYS